MYEKGEFYANLGDTLEIDEGWAAEVGRGVSLSLNELARRRKMPTFDSDAVGMLTTPIGQIEELLERLRGYRVR